MKMFESYEFLDTEHASEEHIEEIKSALEADPEALKLCKRGNVNAALARLRSNGEPAALWLDLCSVNGACV